MVSFGGFLLQRLPFLVEFVVGERDGVDALKSLRIRFALPMRDAGFRHLKRLQLRSVPENEEFGCFFSFFLYRSEEKTS